MKYQEKEGEKKKKGKVAQATSNKGQPTKTQKDRKVIGATCIHAFSFQVLPYSYSLHFSLNVLSSSRLSPSLSFLGCVMFLTFRLGYLRPLLELGYKLSSSSFDELLFLGYKSVSGGNICL